MATYTPNYNLEKPEASDPFGDFRQSYNNNMDIIDANLGGGGGSGGHTIVDENGSDMPAESKLQFTGSVNVTDDAVNGRTVVDISGGAVYGAFIDTDKVISTGTITASVEGTYTATEDCVFDFLMYATGGQNAYLRIDGKNIFSSSSSINRDFVLLRKGQVVTFGSYGTNGSYTVYGLLQGTNGIFAPVIYSDTERVVGVWRDNKPLYQKTFVLSSPLNISESSWTSTGQSVPNGENIIICLGTATDGTMTPLMAYFNNGSIECQTPRNGTSWNIQYITLQYTKTTDVAGSGDYNTYGVPTVHYSTSEQVIGTWTNGKPRYQITLEGSGTFPSGTELVVALPNNADKVVIMGGYVDIGTDWLPLALTLGVGTGSTNGVYCYPNKATGIHIYSSAWTFSEYSVTVQYCKTTD